MQFKLWSLPLTFLGYSSSNQWRKTEKKGYTSENDLNTTRAEYAGKLRHEDTG